MPPFNPLSRPAREEYYGTPKKKRNSGRRRGTSLTIEQWARQQVDKLIAAQVAQIESQRKTYLDELHAESKLEADRGAALAQALQGMDMPGRVQGIFGNASHDIAGLAGGFSEATRGLATAQAGEVSNMLSGTGQEGAVRNEGQAMGDVAYGVGGFFPARSMAEQGASFASQAALEPSFAQRIGQMKAGDVHAEGMKGISDFTEALVEAKSQRPTMIQEMISQRKEFAQSARDDQRDWYLKLAALEMSRGNNERANEYLRLAAQKEGRYRNKDKGLDVDGNLLPGYRINPKTNKVEKVPTSGKKGQGDLPYWGDIQHDMAADADSFTEDIEVADPNGLPGDTITEKKRYDYDRAFNELWAKYSGKVKNKARLRRIIHQLLKKKGFQKKSEPDIGDDDYLSPGTHQGDR